MYLYYIFLSLSNENLSCVGYRLGGSFLGKYIFVHDPWFTHPSIDQMAAIMQATIFLNEIYGITIEYNLLSWNWCQLQIGLDNGLAPIRRQVII